MGIAGFKIPIWEPDSRTGGLLPGPDYARLSVATYGTHDHQPLRALWQQLLAAPEGQRQELQKLADFAGLSPETRNTEYNLELRDRLLLALLRSNSWIAIFSITDLLGSDERFNVPGTSAESNWSRRMSLPNEALCADAQPQFASTHFRSLIAQSGRALPPVPARQSA